MSSGVRIQKLCAWSGFAVLALMFTGFVGLAKLVPPPPPHWNAAQTAHFFVQHREGVRWGVILSMVASTLLMPLVVAITLQMRRIEGRHPALSLIQLGLGTLLVLEFTALLYLWAVAAFRPDRAASQIQLINDMAWIPYLGMTGTYILQVIAFGTAILLDKRQTPIFPRWFGYYNLWVALTIVPATFVLFFHSGPLAWSGLLAFYIPLPSFCTWLVLTPVYLSRAVDHQVAEEVARPGFDDELARLRRELDALTANRAATVGNV
jgi:hypothetical protein